jgi:DNA excision repair protein ERCC-3
MVGVSDSDGEGELEALVRDQANGQCEECGNTDDLDVYDVGDGDGVSLSDLRLLCTSCYEENHTDRKLTESAILTFHEDDVRPFLTASIVADEFGVSTTTARKRLTDLVENDELVRYDQNSKQTYYFKPDYKAASEVVSGLREHIDLTDLDPEAVEAFAKQPYEIQPRDENEYYVIVPQFLDFSIGHLHDQNAAWRTYVINRYVSWYSDIPDRIQEEITLRKRYEKAEMDGNILEFGSEDERERAWEDFDGQNGPLVQREDDTKIRVQQGREFDVVADLVDGGNLPFTPSPIDPDDIRPAPADVTLRDYQQEAWETFEEYGQAGIYWPMGLGKSFFALYAGSRIEGEKLVVVPSSTLEQQWREKIDDQAPDPASWDVRTYQYLTHSNGANLDEYQGADAPKLTIFDESHYIPANKFSQLAMLDTDYRLGLSASPYREDDRTEYIFALTGMPVGVDWQDLMRHGVVEYPDVHIYSYRTQRQKRQDLYDLVEKKSGNGLVFCDGRDEGEEISEQLDVPFVNGDTPAEERLDIIKDHRVVVASRVADEGMSIPSLDWTIEHDFLGGSRRQELQRSGRVMHGRNDTSEQPEGDAEGDGEDPVVDASDGLHIVQMTDDEIEKHGDRLYSLEEKGFNLEYQRRA